MLEVADLDKDGHIDLHDFIEHMSSNLEMKNEEKEEYVLDLF